MKFLILVVFCFYQSFGVEDVFITTGLTTTAGSKLNKKIVGPIDEYNERRTARLSRKYGNALKNNEEAVTNEDNIVHPCNLEDFACIRMFLADNSECSIAEGPVPDPLYLSQTTVFLVYANITMTLTDVLIRGLSNAKMVEFSNNKKTENLVLALEIPTLNETSPRTYVTFSRPAKESIITADYASVEYYSVVITAVLRKIPKLRLDVADVHVFVPDSTPNFYFGPKAYSSTDPAVQGGFAALAQSVPILNREVMLTQAKLFLAAYIQANLCDFGTKIYSL